MESPVIERREAGEFAGSCSTGETCTGYACAQQGGTRQKEFTCRGCSCSCGFFEHWCETYFFKIELFFNVNKKRFGSTEAKIDIQNEMKSCSTSYPMKKIACLRSRWDASCC
jgi:hypothetical protein